MKVPGHYVCKEDDFNVKTDLSLACNQQLSEPTGFVSCFVPRPTVSCRNGKMLQYFIDRKEKIVAFISKAFF